MNPAAIVYAGLAIAVFVGLLALLYNMGRADESERLTRIYGLGDETKVQCSKCWAGIEQCKCARAP